MELRQFCDDFIQIGDIAILQRTTGNEVYDFNFRYFFDCKSIVSEVDSPVLLHIGAVEDYEEMETLIENMGMKLLVSNDDHLLCSTIEKWYPLICEKTPYTKVYDEFPSVDTLLEDFSFPVFIKGNRQTNKHNRSQCIIDNTEAYEKLQRTWKNDSILSWQKVAIREYVKLQKIDDTSYPEMVPISYEFRFFCFEGKCVGYGPYWYMGNKYAMQSEDEDSAIELSEWVAETVGARFVAVDLAKTDDGEWIVIEINDAQESGFVGIEPISLWENTIEAMQNRTWVPIQTLFHENAAIMLGNPYSDMTVDEIQKNIQEACTTQELVDAFVLVRNEYAYIASDLDELEEGTAQYDEIETTVNSYRAMYDLLKEKVLTAAKQEKLLELDQHGLGSMKQLEPFMNKYGYRNGCGWWITNDR